MRVMQVFLALIARVCLSLIFIITAIYTLFNWQMVEQSLVTGLCNWWEYGQAVESVQKTVEYALSIAPYLLIVGAILELLGGLLILIGIQTRLGALLLILFLIPTTLIYNNFWMLQGPDREMQMIMFLKNLAIFGGLLLVLAFGTGPKAEKKSTEKPQKKVDA